MVEFSVEKQQKNITLEQITPKKIVQVYKFKTNYKNSWKFRMFYSKMKTMKIYSDIFLKGDC